MTSMQPAQRRWVLAALMMTTMLAAMDTTIVSTAIPEVVGDLGGFSLFSWVFSIYLLAQTVTIPVYGKLADLYGRKPVLLAGTVVFLVGSAASALAWDMVSLIAFRGLQGLGAGSIMATVNTLAGDLYSVRERARIEGWLSSVWGMAAITGPTLGGALTEWASWRWVFLINLPVGAVALTLLATKLHEKTERHRHQVDAAGAALMLVTGGALMFGLLQGGQAWPWLSWPSLVTLAAAVVLAALTVWRERRAPEPILPGWLFRSRVQAGSNLAMVAMGLVMMGPNTYLPTFGQSVLGLGAIAAGLLLASMSIGWPVASALSGRVYLRLGFRDTALLGALLTVLATGGFLLTGYPGSVPLLFVDQLVLGAGFGLLSTPLLVGVQNTVTWSQRGVVTGANVFSRYLGQSLGAALFGAIFNTALATRLSDAPPNLALPKGLDSVVTALRAPETSEAAASFLRVAMHHATHRVYIGAFAIALLSVAAVLLAPRHFPSSGE